MPALAGDAADLSDAECFDLITSLEKLKSTAAATQTVVTARFDASQRKERCRQGVPADKQGAGIGSQIALARRDSPAKGGRHLGAAKALVRETATLSAEHRSAVDAAMADKLAQLGDAGVVREAKKLA